MAGGQSLAVRDTAATIIANAPAQLAGAPSISPSAWQLSASASVSEAGAAFLGGLTGLSTGAYTLTLNGSDLNTSVADANAIGNLGSAFHLGGYQLSVNGSLTTLSGLSNSAKLIVTPNITDTFTNIAEMSLGSGLLGGTMTVNDSEAITTGQAASFLALLGGSGIPVANVSFAGHVESITDTLANIQTLTGSSAWTNNAAVHADFHLVVADSVANLINPANLSALEGMNSTTLSGNQTVTAANAEALFAAANAIHFSLGASTITIQDSAANLLNPGNSDGEALASVWMLSANDSTTASGAETLLPQTAFHLNHVLTVNDTSANLLDGVLSGIITAADAADAGYGGSVAVTLSDSETLDANAAEALVSLPGFSNAGAPFSIQDASTYLLNPANTAAEADATSVTLAGNETVSASIAAHLSALPNFSLQSNTLTLASNDYANAATLKAIADFGSGFSSGGHSLTMTQDAIGLTPAEYTALQSDNVILNGHALAALPGALSANSSNGSLSVTATGVSGGTVNEYSHSGALLGSVPTGSAAISVSLSDAALGGAAAVTETMPGQTATAGESAPLIILDQNVITTDAGAATFSASGGAGTVQVGANEFLPLYSAGTQPAIPANPVLVFDPTAHSLSLEVGGTLITLLTLGTQTHPASLSASEILVTHFA
jgi:hypothetical protein